MSQIPNYGGDWPSQYQQTQPPQGGEYAPTSGWAVASLVCGLLGLVSCCAVIPSALGVVFGGVALPGINRGVARGKGLAISGIVTGVLGLVLAVAAWGFFVSLANTAAPGVPQSGDELDPSVRAWFERFGVVDDDETIVIVYSNGPSYLNGALIVTDRRLIQAYDLSSTDELDLKDIAKITLTELDYQYGAWAQLDVTPEENRGTALGGVFYGLPNENDEARRFFEDLVQAANDARAEAGLPDVEREVVKEDLSDVGDDADVDDDASEED